jgi:hypothetical protein
MAYDAIDGVSDAVSLHRPSSILAAFAAGAASSPLFLATFARAGANTPRAREVAGSDAFRKPTRFLTPRSSPEFRCPPNQPNNPLDPDVTLIDRARVRPVQRMDARQTRA